MLIDKDVPMTTRDGVVLRADVYRPDGPGRFPVLLSRLPFCPMAGVLGIPFRVDNFWPAAVLGALLVSIVSWALGLVVKDPDD